MDTQTDPVLELGALLAEIEEHGANRRTASPALRQAFADVRRQATQPDLFVSFTIETAQSALSADAARFEREQRDEAALESRRWERRARQAAKLRSYSARCCLYFYSYDDTAKSHWTTCHKCRQPLTYTPDLIRSK